MKKDRACLKTVQPSLFSISLKGVILRRVELVLPKDGAAPSVEYKFIITAARTAVVNRV